MAKEAADNAPAPSEPERRVRYPDGDYLIEDAAAEIDPSSAFVCSDGRLVRLAPSRRSG
jgi:hypothetical protein